MKKTVSVNIKGLNFMIEEDAYELLHDYMQRLEKSLLNQKGSKDIIEDIELRIAELCQQALSDKKQVIEIEDIKQIIATLGQPEDFIEEDEENKSSSEYKSNENTQSSKHLYRDSENAKIAGVCAGLATYFNLDVIIIRIIFLIFLFIGGFGVPIYIILWIVIPKANSSIDRLRMHGKAITVDSVKEEIDQAASRFSTSSKNFANKLRDENTITKRLNSLGRIIRNIIGVALIGGGIFFLIIFLVLIFGGLRFIPIEVQNGFITFGQLGEILLSDSSDIYLAWLGIFLVIASFILFLISNGTFLIAKVKSKWAKISSISLVSFGIIGIIICFYIGSKTGRDFVSIAEIEKQLVSMDTNVLELESVLTSNTKLGNFRIKNSHHHDGFNPLIIKGNRIEYNGIRMTYKTSKDSLFHVYQNFSANSYSYESALGKCKNIKNATYFDSKTLKINPNFSFPKKDKFRAQEVCITIEIPLNKSVKVGERNIYPDPNDLEFELDGYLNYKGEFEVWDWD